MDIKDVEFIDNEWSRPYFLVTYKDDSQVSVPDEPANKDYQEVAEWHKAKKVKPFKFTFKPSHPAG